MELTSFPLPSFLFSIFSKASCPNNIFSNCIKQSQKQGLVFLGCQQSQKLKEWANCKSNELAWQQSQNFLEARACVKDSSKPKEEALWKRS